MPQSLLVVAILHANNWRDICGDREGGFRTVAGLLGDRGSARYYTVLLTLPYVLLLLYMAFPQISPSAVRMPFTFIVVFLSLPLVRRLLAKAARRKTPAQPFDFIALDGATGQLNLVFGMLSIAALLLPYLF